MKRRICLLRNKNSRKEIVMDFEQIMQMLKGKTEIKLVKFISDKGPNSCEACLKHHGEIFRLDDPDKPELPIHPNCRCKYELLTQEEVIAYQDDVQKIKTELIKYGNQIALQATQLLAECDKEIKTHTATFAANAVVTALPIVSKTMEVVKSGKVLEEKVSSTVAGVKLNTMVTALQITIAAMQKINQAADIVHKEMEKAGIIEFAREFNSWLNIGEEVKNCLKNLHYNRLALREQQLHVLPKTPEDAIKQGFVKASNFENMYHKNKNQNDNVKYYNNKTGQEIIFDAKGKVVTDIENIGTYNYFSPGNAIDNVLHIFADVLPYHILGNDEKDTTPVINRIFSRADLWRELGREKYDEFIKKNKQNLKSIITQIKKIVPLFE